MADLLFKSMVFVAMSAVVSAQHRICSRVEPLRENEEFVFDLVNMTSTFMTSSASSHRDPCAVEFRTFPGLRLVLDIVYIRHPLVQRDECERDFLLVGNDFTAVGEELRTSYKFCRDTANTEIVSRDSWLWVVLMHSAVPTDVTLTVRSEPEVSCGQDEVECSPVQCINKTVVCDGVTDCRNGHDEYCYRADNDLNLPSDPQDAAGCFLCGNGTCIKPQQPRYSDKWDIPLWYLCDGVRHCPDYWDERPDVCYRKKGRSEAVLECVPRDAPFGGNTPVRMWFIARCDGKVDCLNGEDEMECPTSSKNKRLKWEPLRALTVALFATGVCGVAAIAFRYERSLRRPNGRVSTSSRRSADSGTSGKQRSCLATRIRQDSWCHDSTGTAAEVKTAQRERREQQSVEMAAETGQPLSQTQV